MLDKIRNLLIVIPSIIAIIGGVGKISYNLFIESVKHEYKRVPAQQTNIGIMFNVALFTIIILDILIVVLAFIGFIIGTSSENKMNITTGYLSLPIIASIIILGANFSMLRTKYINKLNKYEYKKLGGWNFLSIIGNIIIWGVILLILIAAIINAISKRIEVKYNLGELVFENYLSNNDYNALVNCISMVIFCIILFMISLSLFEVRNEINRVVTYYIIRKDNVISCECYLDYTEYYLVIDNGIERYIKKSDVIEIKKVRGNLNPNIKKKKKFKKRVKLKSRKFIKRNRQNTDI